MNMNEHIRALNEPKILSLTTRRTSTRKKIFFFLERNKPEYVYIRMHLVFGVVFLPSFFISIPKTSIIFLFFSFYEQKVRKVKRKHRKGNNKFETLL